MAPQLQLQMRAPAADVVFSRMNGSDFRPDEPRILSLASCIGASWVFGGHPQTLDALSGMVAPGGWVIVGEPYWLRQPSEEYLAASGAGKDDFGTHSGNAAAEYARGHPDDPDLPELLERVAKDKTLYLRWGRETLGWAIYVFRHRPSPRASRSA